MSKGNGGHEVSIFVDKPPENCLCPLCFNVFDDPKQCSNGHCFCASCIASVLSSNHKECPICKTKISGAFLGRNLFAKSVIDEMKTICISCFDRQHPHSYTDCCTWNGLIADRQNHFDIECQFREVICDQNGCNIWVQKRSLLKHQT